MKRKITLKEIADHCKVSISTVSKALNDSPEISNYTKKKIIAFAKKNHYRPNFNAINLRKRQTQTIGVIIPNILNYFFAQVFTGIEKVANERGYSIVSCISNESLEKEIATTQMLQKGQISGLLVSLSEETEKYMKLEHFKKFTDYGVPMVMFDRVSEQIKCDKIVVDDQTAAYNATSHFIKSGCKKIAVISTLDNLAIGKLRIKGYEKALTENNIEINKKYIVKIFDLDFFESEIRFLLKELKVDAILGLEEFTAVNSTLIAKSLGYRIPEDVSIIGFTNGLLPKYVSPTISSVSQHGKYIGETATQMLINRIEEVEETPPDFTTKVVKTSLVLRESTKNE